jgi:hypothetical protein
MLRYPSQETENSPKTTTNICVYKKNTNQLQIKFPSFAFILKRYKRREDEFSVSGFIAKEIVQ